MAAPAGQPSCLEHEFLNWKDDIRLELLATGANEYSSTPAIEILHERSPRFGNTNDLMTFVQEQPGQDEYIQGLIASSIVVGVLFLAWAGLIVFLASTRHSLFSGNSLKISTPPKPPVYPSYQAANQVEDEKEKQEEASHRTEAKPTSKKRKYRSKKHTYDKHDPTKEKKYNKDPTLDKNLTQDQVKDFTKQYRTYKHAYDDWETHSQIARRQLKIMRIVVILGCCIIIASSLLFSIKGFDYLVGSVDSGNTLLSEGTELTQRGIDSVDFYLFKRAQTSASRNQLLGQLNGYCPKIKPQLCEHIESATNCNYEGMPFAVQIENVIDYIGVLPESLLADILAFRNDLIDFLVLLQNWKESLDQFHWALYVAIAFALTLSLLSLYLLIGVIWSWRNSSQNKPLHPAFTCLRSSVVMPLFILLVFLSWTFSTVFMIGSIALSDFCFDSPSDIIMALIYRLEAQGREVSSIVLHFIPYFASGCSINRLPPDLSQKIHMISIAMEKVEVLQSILQSSSFDFQAACGKSPKTILTAAKYVNEQLCSTATCLGEVRSLFGCSYWQPLYSSAVYETTCYNSAEGFAYVAITQLIIVFVAMLVLTLRVAFYPVSVLGDANSDHDGGYIVINNDETESTTGKENRTTPLVVIRQQGAAAGNKMDDEETGALLAQAPEVPESSLVSSGPVAPLTANSQKEITFDPMEFTLEGLGDDETPPPPLPSDPGDFKHGVYALPSITEESVPQSSYNQSFRSRGGDNEKSKLLTTSSSVSGERELLEKEKYGEIEDDQPFEEDEIHPVFMLVRSRPTLADQPPMVAIETEDAKNIEKQEVISWGDFPDDISSGSSTQNTSIKSEPTPSKDDPLLKTYYSDTDLDLESDIPREGEDHASTAGSRSQNSNGLSQRADSDDDSDDDFEFPPPSESNKSFPSGIKTLSALAQEKDDGDSEVPSLEESSESESSTRELDSLRERSNSDDDFILSPMIQPNKNVDEQLPSTEQAGEDPSGDGQQAAEELERKRQTVLPMFERLSSSENTNASMKDDAEKAGQEPSEMPPEVLPMFERLSSSENSSASIRDDAEKVGQELSEMPPEVLPMFERLSSSESSHTSMKNNAEKAVQNLGSEQDELLPVFDRVSSSENSDASMTNNAEQAAQELASEHQETVSVFERLSSIEHKDGEVNDDDASHDSSLDEQEMRDTFPSVTAPDLSPALSPNTLFRRKSTDIFKGGVNKLVMIQKFLGKSYGLVEGEKKTDLASFERSLTKFVDWDDEDDESFEEAGKVRFSKHVKKFKIEDLTKRDTTWGDIWDHLYFDEDTLAEFKYAAYMEECGLVEGGVLDDDDEDVELSLEEITKIVLAEHATSYPNSAVSADSKIKSSLDTSSSSPKRESLLIAEHANDVADQLLSDTGSDKVEYYDEEIIDDPSIRLPLSRRSSSGAEEVSMTESDLMSSDGNFVNPLLSDPEAVDLQNTDDGHMSIFLDIGKYNKSMSDDSTLGDTSRQPSEGGLEEEEEEGHSSM